jgi:hypothetical protein
MRQSKLTREIINLAHREHAQIETRIKTAQVRGSF